MRDERGKVKDERGKRKEERGKRKISRAEATISAEALAEGELRGKFPLKRRLFDCFKNAKHPF